jgi:hypothetical protein
MTETAPRLIASLFVRQYQTRAQVFIDEAHPSGQRHLIVRYEDRPEFAAAIPDDWSEKEVMDLLLWPMKDERAPYPPWEIPARVYGRPALFRWWVEMAKNLT